METSQSQDLTVAIEASDDLITVVLAGDLDVATAPQVEGIADIVQDKRAPTVVVDLRGLTFIDSTGLRFLLLLDDRLRAEGRRLSLVPGPQKILRVFRIAGLEGRLEFAGSSD